jgi:DNA-binding transcriptional ArsR family regulator
MTNARSSTTFAGFRSPTYTQVPDELFDELMCQLSGAELKVLLYIVRRTFGFKRGSDHISLSQICHGITTRSGHVLDHGTGLSQSTVLVALKALVGRGVIIATRRMSVEHGNEATTYRPRLAGVFPETQRSPSPKTVGGPPQKAGTQETVSQQTAFALRNSKAAHGYDDTEHDFLRKALDRPVGPRDTPPEGRGIGKEGKEGKEGKDWRKDWRLERSFSRSRDSDRSDHPERVNTQQNQQNQTQRPWCQPPRSGHVQTLREALATHPLQRLAIVAEVAPVW